jgi:hypothetical protein
MIADSRRPIYASVRHLLRHARHPRSLLSLVWKNIKFPFTPQGAVWVWFWEGLGCHSQGSLGLRGWVGDGVYDPFGGHNHG